MSIGKTKNNLGKAEIAQISHRKAILKGLTRKSLNKLAIEAGVSNGTADDWTDNQIEKPTRTVSDFLSHHGIREDWWRTGKGEVFEEKPTLEQKTTDNKEMEEIKISLVEYSVVPKIVLEGSQLVSKAEIDRAEAKIQLIIQSKDDLIKELRDQLKSLRSAPMPAK